MATLAPATPTKPAIKSTAIRATKIGVWKIGDQYFEDFETTEREIRRLVVLELLGEENPEGEVMMGSDEAVAAWVADNWAIIEKRVKEATAGS